MADEVTNTPEKAPAPKAAQPPVLDLRAEAVRRGVEKFIDAHLRNSPFSQDTTAWNHFHEGKPVLIESILSEMEA